MDIWHIGIGLLPGSFSHLRDGSNSHTIELSSDGSGAGINLNKFFQDAESIKDELKELESLHQRLQSCHEHIKTLHSARAALKKAKAVKGRLKALELANAANPNLPGCGLGSSSDQTRMSLVDGLRKKLKDSMEGFDKLREKLSSEYKETVQRRYFTAAGENLSGRTADLLISTGENENETFFRKAIQEQGRSVKDMERDRKNSLRLIFQFSVVMLLIVLLIVLWAIKPWVG
ncbi:hypothetical protein BT93_L1654 [Corymbia citriodora subsp. variegata]|uniref:Syntaxin N-terminal domain-containing protein n=1 Tax=Corymbia citriodora subsp. variegata TaxID=360336 RepID=A0A8T0CWF6_CORYI|nr:hypothetical protein BT93_L1654 [Corymbia citriodora subsp. variegata]